MRYAHLMLPRLAFAVGATALLAGAALAQYSPYGTPQQSSAGYGAPGAHTSPQTYAPQTNAPQTYTPQSNAPQSNASQSYAPQYMAMMYQNAGSDALNQTLDSVPPGPMQQPTTGAAPAQTMQMQQMPSGYQPGAPTPAADCNCNSTSAAGYAQPAMDNYTASARCASGNCGMNYNTFSGGCNAGSYSGGNVCYAAGAGCGPRRRWFGGIYGLYMNLEQCGYKPLVFQTNTPGVGYYPTDNEVTMTTQDLQGDGFGGAEVRFGATFAACSGYGYSDCGGCNSCNSCGQCAWEVGYWGLFRESTTAYATDSVAVATDGTRMYGMIDFRGWESNPGGAYRPMDDYFDYGPPTTDNTTPYDIEIRQFYARRSFSVQNLEVNLLRLPLLGGGGGGCGSCDTCTAGACGMQGGCGGCGGYGGGGYGFSGRRCQLSTLLGIRYMRFDDDFLLHSDWERMDTNALGWHQYNIQADNQLVGFQLGANGSYYCGQCGRFGLHCYSNAGIYGNRAEVTQWMSSSAGTNRFVNHGSPNAYTNYDNNNVAFVGELRLGASYQCTCNCRLYGGYRVMGISGVAISYDQIPDYFNTPAQVGIINCNGSYFLHGLQTGIEFLY